MRHHWMRCGSFVLLIAFLGQLLPLRAIASARQRENSAFLATTQDSSFNPFSNFLAPEPILETARPSLYDTSRLNPTRQRSVNRSNPTDAFAALNSPSTNVLPSPPDPLANLPAQARVAPDSNEPFKQAPFNPTLLSTSLLNQQPAPVTAVTAKSPAKVPPLHTQQPDATTTVVSTEGGTLLSSGGEVRIEVSSATVDQATRLYYESSTSLPDTIPGLAVAGAMFSLRAETEVNRQPIDYFPFDVTIVPRNDATPAYAVVTPSLTLAVQYTDAQVQGLDLSSLALYRYVSARNGWIPLPTAVYRDQRLAVAETEYTGEFALFATPLAARLRPSEYHLVLDPDDDVGHAIWNGNQLHEITYNMRLAQEVKQRFDANTCDVATIITRNAGDHQNPIVSRSLRAQMAVNFESDVFVTLGFNTLNGVPWGQPSNGGPAGWVRSGRAEDGPLLNTLFTRVSQYTGRSHTRQIAQNPVYTEFNSVPGAYTHLETLFLDHNYDWPIINTSFSSISDGVYAALRDQLSAQGMVCGGPGNPPSPYPAPLSPEERARLRNLGYQNWMRYRGDPVNNQTGNHLQQFTDLAVPGKGGLDLVVQRTYNSQDKRDGHFGTGWSSVLDMNLRLANDGSVDVRYADGSGVFFQADGANFKAGQQGVFDTLSRNGDNFLLTTPDQISYHFAVSGSSGRLTMITDRRGNRITLEYNAEGNPTTINDSAGRIFTLNYDAGHVVSIADPLGRTLGYAYVNNDLISTTDANGGMRKFEYANHLMMTMTDPEGMVYLQNTYDEQGRIVDQIDASGNHNTFDYSTPGQTTFIDNLNSSTTDIHDSLFRVTATRDVYGKTEYFGYDSNNNVTRYTDKNNQTWLYTYDARGNMLTATDPRNHTITYTYNPANDLTSVTDQGGPGASLRTTTYTYDTQGSLRGINQPDGTQIQATYDDHGQLLTLTDANLHTTTYGYDAQGNLIEVSDPSGSGTTYSYDAVGRQTRVVDANGRIAQFAYDNNDNITRMIDPKNQTTTFKYDRNDNLWQMTDRRGAITSYQYDENLKLTAETDPQGHTMRYTYDRMYNRASATDGRGNTTLYRYDALYRPSAIEDTLGGTTRFEYDSMGNLTSVVDALGQISTFAYDELNRLQTQTDALLGVTTYEYDAVGRVTALINPRNARTAYQYDLLDRVTVVRDALNGETRFSYDAAGNLIASVDANNNPTQLFYDANDRMVEQRDALGYSMGMAYDNVGNTTIMTDALGYTTRYAYDANDNLTTITDALGGNITLAYDAEDRVIAQTDPNNHTTQFAYDFDERLKTVTEAGGQTTRFSYDDAHNLLTQTNAKGNTWAYTYDALNRQTTTTDPLSQTTILAYDLRGQLLSLTDARGIKTGYSYDKLGRMTAVVHNQSSAPADVQINVTTRYGYDAVGNLTSLTDGRGEVTGFQYDALNRLTVESNPRGRRWHYSYDPAGNLQTRTDANGQQTTYRYDPADQLTQIGYPDNTGVFFAYDAVRNQIAMTDTLGVTTNDYDGLRRLIASTNSIGQQTAYTYDAAGNRTSITYPDGRVQSTEYDASNFPVREIDPAGNAFVVTRDATHNITAVQNPNKTLAEYEYDAAERLTAVRNLRQNRSVINTFAYTLDPVGNRVQTIAKYPSGQPRQLTTNYTYDPLERLTRSENSEEFFTEYTFDAVGNRTRLRTNCNLIEECEPNERDPLLTTIDYRYDATNALISTVRSTVPDYPGAGQPASNRALQTANTLFAFTQELEAQSGIHIETATASELITQANLLIDDLQRANPPGTSTTATRLAALRTAVEAAGADGQIDSADVVARLGGTLDRAVAANKRTGGEMLTTLYDYDLNGNRAQRLTLAMCDEAGNTCANDRDSDRFWQRTKYAYDFENRLTQVWEYGNTANGDWHAEDETRLSYDGYGRLFRRLHNTYAEGEYQSQNKRQYVYDGLDPIAEYADTGKQYTNLYRGLGGILSTEQLQRGQRSGKLNYFHHDGLGSVTAITKPSGSRAKAYRYSDYGTILNERGYAVTDETFDDEFNRYTYTGQEWDEKTGLTHFYAREYDSATGTWLQQDPYRGQLQFPTTLQRYGYVGNNPINQFDLYGFWGVNSAWNWAKEHKKEIAAVAIGAVVTAAVVVAAPVVLPAIGVTATTTAGALLISASTGGVAKGLSNAANTIVETKINKGSVNWKYVGASALGGVVEGGVCGIVTPLVCNLGGGFLGGATEQITKNLVDNKQWHNNVIGEGAKSAIISSINPFGNTKFRGRPPNALSKKIFGKVGRKQLLDKFVSKVFEASVKKGGEYIWKNHLQQSFKKFREQYWQPQSDEFDLITNSLDPSSRMDLQLEFGSDWRSVLRDLFSNPYGRGPDMRKQ